VASPNKIVNAIDIYTIEKMYFNHKLKLLHTIVLEFSTILSKDCSGPGN